MSNDEEIYSMTGSVIKLETELIFIEIQKNMSVAPFIYGVLDVIEDSYELMGTKDWHVYWTMKNLMIHSNSLEHLLPVLEIILSWSRVCGRWRADSTDIGVPIISLRRCQAVFEKLRTSV